MPDKLPRELLEIMQAKQVAEGWTVSTGAAKEKLQEMNERLVKEEGFEDDLKYLDTILDSLQSIAVDPEEKYQTIEEAIEHVGEMEEKDKEMLRVFLTDQSKGIDLAILNMAQGCIDPDEYSSDDYTSKERGIVGGLLQEMIDTLGQHVRKDV